MTPQNILLYEKCHSGNCTPEERKLMEEYMNFRSLLKRMEPCHGGIGQVRTAITAVCKTA